MGKKQDPKDQSVHAEPQFTGNPFEADPNDPIGIDQSTAKKADDEDRIERSVWDEKAVEGFVADREIPAGYSYQSWREENAENTSSRLQWATVIAIVICSGQS